MTIQKAEVEHCNDNTEDILEEKIIAGGTFDSNIMTIPEVESRDSTAGSRYNEKDENNIISKRDNHDIDEIVSNNEIASATGIANEDNGNKVNGNEVKLEEKRLSK